MLRTGDRNSTGVNNVYFKTPTDCRLQSNLGIQAKYAT